MHIVELKFQRSLFVLCKQGAGVLLDFDTCFGSQLRYGLNVLRNVILFG